MYPQLVSAIFVSCLVVGLYTLHHRLLNVTTFPAAAILFTESIRAHLCDHSEAMTFIRDSDEALLANILDLAAVGTR